MLLMIYVIEYINMVIIVVQLRI